MAGDTEMNELLAGTFFLIFVCMLVVMLPYFRSLRIFLDALRHEAPATWQKLGQPSLSLEGSPASSMRVVGYLFRAQFAGLPGTTAALARKTRRYLIVVSILACVMLVFGLFASTLMH